MIEVIDTIDNIATKFIPYSDERYKWTETKFVIDLNENDINKIREISLNKRFRKMP